MKEEMTSAAALRIFGDDLIPDEITLVLGCEPSNSAIKGQVIRREKTGKEHTARTGGWDLDAADRTPADLNSQIMEIIARLNPDPDVWSSLSARFTLDLFCGLFMAKSSEGLSLSPEALLALGTRHIELALCLYDPIETTDEKVEQ